MTFFPKFTGHHSHITRTIFIIPILILAGLILFPVSSYAASGTIGGRPANPDPTNERTKSIFVKKIAPGTQATDTVEVVNNSDVTKTVLVYGADAVSSSGGAFACAQAVDEPLQVGKWIALEKNSVDIPAGGKTKIPFTITAPANAEPGEQNGCIVMQEKTGAVIQNGIGLSFRTAIRVAILVPGDIQKVLTPLSITTSHTASNVIISPKIQNTGNVSLDTDVTASLRSLFGMTIGTQTNTYPVLRDQITEWNFEIAKPFWGGFYQASYDLSYDASNNFIGSSAPKEMKIVHGQSKVVFVIPSIPALLLYVAIIAAIAGAIWKLRTRQLHNAAVKGWKEHTVSLQDNLQTIAKTYTVNWKTLAKENNIKAPYVLGVGQVIIVPSKKQPRKRRITRKK